MLLRYVLAGALIEEAWKHFILRISTWKQMTMETVGDGIAAAAVVGTAFSAVLYLAWQAAYHVLPPDLEILRSAMPDFLSAGPVASFIHALLFIPSHFGYAGLMGVLYGFAKGSEQKKHAGRAGFMLTVSFLLAVLVHGVIESLVGYGFVTGQKLWLILGFAAEALLAFLMASALVAVRDSSLKLLWDRMNLNLRWSLRIPKSLRILRKQRECLLRKQRGVPLQHWKEAASRTFWSMQMRIRARKTALQTQRWKPASQTQRREPEIRRVLRGPGTRTQKPGTAVLTALWSSDLRIQRKERMTACRVLRDPAYWTRRICRNLTT